jgi:hypothetical protein
MAEKYCLDYGLLPMEKAQEIVDRLRGGNKNKAKK